MGGRLNINSSIILKTLWGTLGFSQNMQDVGLSVFYLNLKCSSSLRRLRQIDDFLLIYTLIDQPYTLVDHKPWILSIYLLNKWIMD